MNYTAKFIGTSTPARGAAKLVFNAGDDDIVVSPPTGRSAAEFVPLIGQTFDISVSTRPYVYTDKTGREHRGISKKLTRMTERSGI